MITRIDIATKALQDQVYISNIEHQLEQRGANFEKLEGQDAIMAEIIESFISGLQSKTPLSQVVKETAKMMKSRGIYRGSSYDRLNDIKKHYINTGTIKKGRMIIKLKSK